MSKFRVKDQKQNEKSAMPKIRKEWIIAAILLLIISLSAGLFKTGSLKGPYLVASVVDGDTIRVMIDGKEVKLRMIGVDTPESVHSDESQNTAEGVIASAWLRDQLDGKHVYLEYDKEPEDQYGRALAYVYLDDRTTMVERLLLEYGLAKMVVYGENDKYAEEFRKIEAQAKKDGAGFWGTGYFK